MEFIFSLILGLLNFLNRLRAKFKYGFYVTPHLIYIPTGWGIVKNVKVVNNNPYPLYSIQIKISPKSNKIKLDRLKLERLEEESFSQRIDNKPDTFEVGLKEIMLGGTDSDGKMWHRIIINDIDPHSTINYKLLIPKLEIEAGKTAIELRVTDFSKEQPNILQQNGKISIPFKIKDK